ncbi:MAG: SDR family NAD(P)-dependent oxidoreductase [Candidatus Obscuribacterales bacterium]|nr:SDR family NAD(P)-dependent oxidoreductase [Candidatus Obscuribacterales bacterium]
MDVLVTGASGFIGKHLVRALAQAGYNLTLLGRNKPPFDYQFISCDLRDWQSVESSIGTRRFDVVYHLAGMVSYRTSDLAEQMRVNVEGTRNLMRIAHAMGARVIQTSSIAALGLPDQELVKEGSFGDETIVYNLAGRGLSYCDTKHAAEQVCLEFFRQGLNVVLLNPGIVFGEGDTHPHHLAIFRSMKDGVLAVPPGGIPFSDIEDVVAAHLSAISKGRAGERYNLVSANLTFREAACIFAQIYNCRPPLFELPEWLVRLAGEFAELAVMAGAPKEKVTLTRQQAFLSCKRIFFKSDKAKEELGFVATPFKQTVERTAPYYLSRV